MLGSGAKRNNFPNPTHFTDDGISGTRFDRPAFTAMMEEVEAGRVDTIIVKDMSRLGRELLHLMVKSSVAPNNTDRDTIQLDFLQKACKVA